MLAATAENPRLLDPLREVIRQNLTTLKDTSEDLDAALLAWLAVEGLSSFEMHDISPFSEEDRERILKAMDRLLSKDRKSTRLNSSHANISYAVFCLKKKKR